VFKLWEGLGYYSRCRNLLHTARFIAAEYKGKFPDTYEAIRSLKGIGPYTAAAIGSFAFNLPYAVVDGNVFRVLSRVFGIDTATDSTAGKKIFTALANELIDKKEPGIYNQAIMDFGAVVCKPVSPVCNKCCFKKTCVAFRENKVNEWPVKDKKIKIKKRWFYYFVLEHENEVLITPRLGKDIWQHLQEFPLIEMGTEATEEEIGAALKSKKWIPGRQRAMIFSPVFRQQLTHQLITGRFIRIRLAQKIKPAENWQWVKYKDLKHYAFPKFMYNQLDEIYAELKRG
jgi:A/G-specific adenine glycosylase